MIRDITNEMGLDDIFGLPKRGETNPLRCLRLYAHAAKCARLKMFNRDDVPNTVITDNWVRLTSTTRDIYNALVSSAQCPYKNDCRGYQGAQNHPKTLKQLRLFEET